MWNTQSKQQPLLKPGKITTSVKPGALSKKSKRKRFSQSFHNAYPTTSSPQSVPIRVSPNSPSLVPSSTGAGSNHGGSAGSAGSAGSGGSGDRHHSGTPHGSHAAVTPLGTGASLLTPKTNFINLNASQSAEMERSVLSDGLDAEAEATQFDAEHDADLSSDNNGELDDFLDDGLDDLDHLNQSQRQHGDSFLLGSLESEHVPRGRDPLLSTQLLQGQPGQGNLRRSLQHVHQTHQTHQTQQAHGTVSVVEDESQLSAMLPGGAHFDQRIKLRNDMIRNIDKKQLSLPMLSFEDSKLQSEDSKGSKHRSKRIKIARKKGHKSSRVVKKDRSVTTFVPSASLPKNRFDNEKLSHSLQELRMSSSRSSRGVTAPLTHENISRREKEQSSQALHATQHTEQTRLLSEYKKSFQELPQLVGATQNTTKVFRPREQTTYNILDDAEMPDEARKAAKRAKMRQKQKMTTRERRKQAKMRHKELQKEYERTRFGKNDDMNVLDSEATSSLGGSSEDDESGYMHLVRKHKRRANHCRNYFCCCICCICDNSAWCDRKYRKFLKLLSRLWMHKCLVMAVVLLLWFVLANVFFWFHDFTDDDSTFDKSTKWIPNWIKKDNNFAMINLIIGSLAVLFQLFCVLQWYAAYSQNQKLRVNKLKIERKYETLKQGFESLQESHKLVSASNMSLDHSFDLLTQLSENFETIFLKYDKHLTKLAQLYNEISVHHDARASIATSVTNASVAMIADGSKASLSGHEKHLSLTSAAPMGAEEDDIKITENAEKQDIVDPTDGDASASQENTKYRLNYSLDGTAAASSSKEVSLLDQSIRDTINTLFKVTRTFARCNCKTEALILRKLKKDLELTTNRLNSISTFAAASPRVPTHFAAISAPSLQVGARSGRAGARSSEVVSQALHASRGPQQRQVLNSVGGAGSQLHHSQMRSIGPHGTSMHSLHRGSSESGTMANFGKKRSSGNFGHEGMMLAQYDHFVSKIPKKYKKHFFKLADNTREERMKGLERDAVAYPVGAGVGVSDMQIAYSDIGSVLSALLRSAGSSSKSGKGSKGATGVGVEESMSGVSAVGPNGRGSLTASSVVRGISEARTKLMNAEEKGGMEERRGKRGNGSERKRKGKKGLNLDKVGTEFVFDVWSDLEADGNDGMNKMDGMDRNRTDTTDKYDPSLQANSEINDVDGGYLVYGDDDMIATRFDKNRNDHVSVTKPSTQVLDTLDV